MTATAYSNDVYPDIAYMLVFNYISLQGRIRMRAVCHRWKAIIEADTSQMSTLRVFGRKDHLEAYIKRTSHREVPSKKRVVASGTDNGPKYHANRWNTILLSRPASPTDRSDLTFLLRLFPSVVNLALTWNYGEFLLEVGHDETIKAVIDRTIELDLISLLRTWAPNLRQLYLVTREYEFNENDPHWYPLITVNSTRATQIWSCITLAAPILTSLSLQGVHMDSVPESLVLPTLTELAYYYADALRPKSVFLATSPDRLHKLAPVLESLRLMTLTESELWSSQVPETVRTLAFSIPVGLGPGMPTTMKTPCPSITHLEYLGDIVSLFPHKFPSVKSLRLVEVSQFSRWMVSVGEEYDSVAFLTSTLPRLLLSPLTESITELTIVSFARFLYLSMNLNGEAFFRGLAVTFQGLARLNLSIPADSEANHKRWHGQLTDCHGRYLPKVVMNCTLQDSADQRKRALGGSGSPAASTNHCHLSSGCVFLQVPDQSDGK